MAAPIPLPWITNPPFGNNRETVQTTGTHVNYFDPEETAKEDKFGALCCRLVVGVLILVSCAAVRGSYNSNSRSTYSSTPTSHWNNRYTPSYTSREDPFLKMLSPKDEILKNIGSPINRPCGTDECNEIDKIDEILNSINKSVDPCDNFYNYACQGWLENNPRPEYMPEWSVFSKLRAKNTKRVIRILEKPDKVSSDQWPLNYAKQFYRKCLSTGTKMSENEDKAAIQLMSNTLENYGGWPILYENDTWNKSRFNWISATVALKRQFKSSALLDVVSYQYPSWIEKTNVIYIQPPSSSSSSLESLDKFVEFKLLQGFKSLANLQTLIVNISKVFLEYQGKSDVNLTHLEDQALNALLVQILLPSPGEPFSEELSPSDKILLGMKFQENAANTSLLIIQSLLDRKMRPFKNKLNLHKLLQAFYKNTNVYVRTNEPVVITDIAYLLNLAKFVTETKEEAIANYLSFRMTLLMIPLSGHSQLNKLVDDFQNLMSGTSGIKGKKETCAEVTQEKFHTAVGQQFVQNKSLYKSLEFEQARIIFTNLKVSFKRLIESSYMSYLDKTLIQLETKITKLCLGYPNWMDGSYGSKIQSEYQGLTINESATFLEQNIAVNSWAVDKSYGLLKKQLGSDDSCQWTRFAGYVGAYNVIAQYSVYLPIGIMRSPFYNVLLPMALIYGKLGSILGHEIIHGLAGPGWTKMPSGELTSSGKCLVNQYSEFSTATLREENVTLNGVQTLQENIPDNAGLLGAYKAFKDSMLLDGRNRRKLDGLKEFTDEQLFFLGFAQNWCEASTEKTLRRSLKNDDHPPGMFRVLGSLQNSKEFASAWKCPSGSNMNPVNYRKCKMF